MLTEPFSLKRSINKYLEENNFKKHSWKEYKRAKEELKNSEGSEYYDRCIQYIAEWMEL